MDFIKAKSLLQKKPPKVPLKWLYVELAALLIVAGLAVLFFNT